MFTVQSSRFFLCNDTFFRTINFDLNAVSFEIIEVLTVRLWAMFLDYVVSLKKLWKYYL